MKLALCVYVILFASVCLAQAPAETLPHYSTSTQLSEDEKRINEESRDSIEPQLYGGRPIKAGELTPSVNIGNCTGTVVGPKTLLTAGHCRSSGSSVTFVFKNRRYSGTCTRHPDYSKNGWLNNDFALCKLTSEVQDMKPFGVISDKVMKVGDVVTMQGYGYGSGGVLNVGQAPIIRINYMDLYTRGRVRLGGGDSGGALFDEVKDLINGPFNVVGINSRGDSNNTSYFNRFDLERSQSFFKDYARSKNLEICGVNKDCGSGGSDPDLCPSERLGLVNAKEIVSNSTDLLNKCLESK